MRALATALGLLGLIGASVAGADEQFPTRPMTIVNPFPPGGQADLTGRPAGRLDGEGYSSSRS